MRKNLLVIALLALVLSACRIETNIIMNIEEDGSAEVGAEVGFDEEFMQFLEQSGGSPEDIFTDLPQFEDGDGVATERVDGDMTYYGFISTIEDITSYDPNTDTEDAFSSFEVSVDDSSARIEAELVATDLEGLGGDEFPIDPSMITDEFFSANLLVSMPGEVTEHDADEVRGDGTLVWNIPLSGSKSVNAVSDFGSSSGNLILIILLVVLAIGIIAAVVATVVSRRESQKAVEAAAASHADAASPEPPSTEDGPEVDQTLELETAGTATDADETLEVDLEFEPAAEGEGDSGPDDEAKPEG